MALLDRRLEHAGGLPESLRGEFHETLDRLIVAAQLRYPVVGELARSVRFRAFDQPVIETAREQVLPRRDSSWLPRRPSRYARPAERIEALVPPEPLTRLGAERIGGRRARGRPRAPHAPLLQDPSARRIALVARRRTGGRHRPLLARGPARAAHRDARRGLGAARGRPGRRRARPRPPPRSPCSTSISARTRRPMPTPWPRNSAQASTGRRCPRRCAGGDRREQSGRGPRASLHVPHGRGGFEEERVTRGLHPMIARRLHLWRLANFDVTRLPAVEDVHLFHCAAHENPSDERLVALAEVRDLTPVRDGSGRLRRCPSPSASWRLPRRDPPRAAGARRTGGCTETACFSTCGRR